MYAMHKYPVKTEYKFSEFLFFLAIYGLYSFDTMSSS